MNIVLTDLTNTEDYIMKRILFTAVLSALVIGVSAQAGSLSNDEIFDFFSEEAHLTDRSMGRVDMASMDIRGRNDFSSEDSMSLNTVYEIFGEE
jgi:hypothetical protein